MRSKNGLGHRHMRCMIYRFPAVHLCLHRSGGSSVEVSWSWLRHSFFEGCCAGANTGRLSVLARLTNVQGGKGNALAVKHDTTSAGHNTSSS